MTSTFLMLFFASCIFVVASQRLPRRCAAYARQMNRIQTSLENSCVIEPTTPPSAGCPDFATNVEGGLCFVIWEPLTWAQAQTYCENFPSNSNGRLVVLDTAGKLQAASDFLANIGTDKIWVAATSNSGGTMSWSTGSIVANASPKDCGELDVRGGSPGIVTTDACTNTHPFMCEYSE